MTTETVTDPATTSSNPGGDPSPFDSWKTSLPADDQAYLDKNGYKDFNHLLAADKGAMAKLGRPATDLIVKPSGEFAENKDQYLDALRALGAPAEAAGYGEAPKLDGLEFKDGAWGKLTAIFTENGVPPFMVGSVLAGVAEVVKGELGQQKAPEVIAQERMDAGMAKLKELHGAKADAMIEGAKTLMKAKGDDDLIAFLEESGFGSDPRFITFMDKINADYAESGLINRDGGATNGGGMTPEAAREELRKLEADQGFMKQLNNRNDPNHKQAVDRRLQLIAAANPKPS